MSDGCRFCGDERDAVLETHHIVPSRYGGSNKKSNLITVCSNCHAVLEDTYDDRFYSRLGILTESDPGERGDKENQMRLAAKELTVVEQVKALEEASSGGEHLDRLDVEVGGEKISRAKIEEIVVKSLETVAEKVQNGRVRDEEKESVRQDWVHELGYLARSYAELREAE